MKSTVRDLEHNFLTPPLKGQWFLLLQCILYPSTDGWVGLKTQVNQYLKFIPPMLECRLQHVTVKMYNIYQIVKVFPAQVYFSLNTEYQLSSSPFWPRIFTVQAILIGNSVHWSAVNRRLIFWRTNCSGLLESKAPSFGIIVNNFFLKFPVSNLAFITLLYC